MNKFSSAVGIQAVALGGSFHEIAAREYFNISPERELTPYISHPELMKGFYGHKVREAVIAVDNTCSGRVQSAVASLVGLPRSVHIVGSVVVPIEQRLLYAPGTKEADIDTVMSQKPALDQCSGFITKAGLGRIECEDTLQAAQEVARTGGIIDGKTVGAIASELAGITNELTVGSVINDRTDNATKFWRISRDKDWNDSGTHASIVFDLPSNNSGSLLRAIQIISTEHGYDLTDIDSHLHPHTSGKRSFYAELLRSDDKNPKKLIAALIKNNIRARLMGVYDSEELIITEDNGAMPVAISNDAWDGREGLLLEDESTVLHIEASNKPAALLGILKCLSGVNIVDLSRPTIPHGDQFSRGFYVAIGADSSEQQTLNAANRLDDAGYTVTQHKYKNGKLKA